MNFKKMIVLLLVPLFCLGCAGKESKQSKQKKLPEVEEVFETNIKQNGTKVFTYGVTMNSSKKGKDSRKQRRGDRGRDRADIEAEQRRENPGAGSREARSNKTLEKRTEELKNRLNAKLAGTGYCREGYIELDHYFGKSQFQIRGECKEDATESDREKFPTLEAKRKKSVLSTFEVEG